MFCRQISVNSLNLRTLESVLHILPMQVPEKQVESRVHTLPDLSRFPEPVTGPETPACAPVGKGPKPKLGICAFVVLQLPNASMGLPNASTPIHWFCWQFLDRHWFEKAHRLPSGKFCRAMLPGERAAQSSGGHKSGFKCNFKCKFFSKYFLYFLQTTNKII